MRFKKVKVNQTKLCWNEQDLYFHQKTIREYSVKHDSFFHTCLTFCKYVWEKPNLCVKYHTCSFWQMFDFYPTCLEKTKHVGIFTPGCYFPHMFGFWHIGMGKGTHVCKKPHNYMFANVWHFPHMCGKSHWHAYFPLSYGWLVMRIVLAIVCCRFGSWRLLLKLHFCSDFKPKGWSRSSGKTLKLEFVQHFAADVL